MFVLLLLVIILRQGEHTPGPRTVAVGVYPVQNIRSQILDSQDVSYLMHKHHLQA